MSPRNVDRDSYTLKLVKKGGGDGLKDDSMDFGNDSMQFSGLSQSTEKWNPLLFAVYAGNLELVKFIIQKTAGNTKRLLKIPGIFKTQEVSKLFPFIVAMRQQNQAMFQFFWEDLSYVYCNEDTFESLFRLLVKREKPELVGSLLSCKASMTLFLSMSYSYRLEFVDHILQIKGDILKEINQQVIEEQQNESSGGSIQHKKSPMKNRIIDSDSDLNSNANMDGSESRSQNLEERMNAVSNSDLNSQSSFDAQEFVFQKRQSLDRFFIGVYEKFSQPPFSL